VITSSDCGAGIGRDPGAGRRGLRFARTHQADGTLSPELLTNAGIDRPGRTRQQAAAGTGMVRSATALLFLLGGGLLAVSLAAQYSYLLRERHQHWPSLIEALALDLGMLIFSLLALGLARGGRDARTERVLILACASGSSLMNYAAADVTSPRSVLAYAMPPIFLAVVADRVISVVRRHYLGRAGGSAWLTAGHVTMSIGRGGARAALYSLRLAIAPVSTLKGARAAVLLATPVPALEAPVPRMAIEPPGRDDREPVSGPPDRRRPGGHRDGTKTARFLELVTAEHGPLAGFDLSKVGAVAKELAPQAELHEGSARSALRTAVLAAHAAAAAPATRDGAA